MPDDFIGEVENARSFGSPQSVQHEHRADLCSASMSSGESEVEQSRQTLEFVHPALNTHD
jgi:hypothetical protein